MRILITNTRLDRRGGAESFVRDLARGLQDLGHSVLAYTTDPRQRPRLLENDLLPVATDLEHLQFVPDIIHAQHHLEAMTAISALPGVPAIYMCHGAVWRETVPRHPRIFGYVSVSRTLAQRMAVESNIAPDDIAVVPNGVDVDRFRQKRSLPDRPARALFYNQRHRKGSQTVAAIREAAARLGLSLDFVGWPFGPRTAAPEQMLPGYDIVFASGRSAIEAMACGCAVIIIGRTSCGDLVGPVNFDHFKDVNFSIAVNSPPPSVDRIVDAVRRYSADDARAVSARIREERASRQSVQALVDAYQRAIDKHRRAIPDLREESLAISRYLRTIVPLINTTDRRLGGYWSSADRASSFEELREQVALLQQRIDKSP